MLYQIGEFADMIGVSIQTLRNWDTSGKLRPHSTTRTGVRQYSAKQLRDYIDQHNIVIQQKAIGFCAITEDQDLEDLSLQMDALSDYMKGKNYDYSIETAIVSDEQTIDIQDLQKENATIVLLEQIPSVELNVLATLLKNRGVPVELVPYAPGDENTIANGHINVTHDISYDALNLAKKHSKISRKDALNIGRVLLEYAENYKEEDNG